MFNELDGLVADWKKRLEFIVADGLKKIKRSTKEKKTMMKYLPGDATASGSVNRETHYWSHWSHISFVGIKIIQISKIC